jgi:hypothetical protein
MVEDALKNVEVQVIKVEKGELVEKNIIGHG